MEEAEDLMASLPYSFPGKIFPQVSLVLETPSSLCGSKASPMGEQDAAGEH